MRKLFENIGVIITKIIDFFYPPFRKYVKLQFFRYGAVGCANLIFDWVLYFVTYNFIIQKEIVQLGCISISAHIASLLFSFPISLMTGFLLQKYVTFTASVTRGHSQLLRYIGVVFVNLLINYFGLKLFVEVWHVYPTPSKMIVTVITVILSYNLQKKYTFKTKKDDV